MEEIRWRALYKNGQYLPQYNDSGESNGYKNIDRDNLLAFDIVKHVGKEDKLIFRMFLDEGQRLIYRRRVTQQINSPNKSVVYLVGWQQKINGKNIQSINYVFEDGHVEQAGKWVGGEPILIAEEMHD